MGVGRDCDVGKLSAPSPPEMGWDSSLDCVGFSSRASLVIVWMAARNDFG